MFYIKRNLPLWERVVRFVLGGVVAAVAAAGLVAGVWAWVAWGSAATLALTAVVGFCPACAMVGRRAFKA